VSSDYEADYIWRLPGMNSIWNGLRIQAVIGCLISVVLIGTYGVVIPNATYALEEGLPIEIKADILMNSALQNIDEKEWKGAIIDFEKLMKLDLELPDLMYFHYGKALLKTGNYNESLVIMKKYLMLTDKKSTSYKAAIDLAIEADKQKKEAERFIQELEKGMVLIKGNCFIAGDTFDDGYDNEKPVHTVCVDDFYIGKYEVTVGEFKQFIDETGYKTEAETGDGIYYLAGGLGGEVQKDIDRNWHNPGFDQKDSHPVVGVSWNDVQRYTDWLNKKSGMNFRLPTEIEWEYAARSGGKTEKWSGTSSESELVEYAWYNASSELETHPVGQKKPNGLGIYDMSGNAWEWCSDWYEKDYYENSQKNNPKGPSNGSFRVGRGGCYGSLSKNIRVTNRVGNLPEHRDCYKGFRLARTP